MSAATGTNIRIETPVFGKRQDSRPRPYACMVCNMAPPQIRKGQGQVKLTHEEFLRRLGQRFDDPAFAAVRAELGRLLEVACRTYDAYRRSPRTRKTCPRNAES